MYNSSTYKLASPVTFRRSSSKILAEGSKKNIGWGGNIQNIEGSIRECYIPDGFHESLKEKCLYWLETWDTSVFSDEELGTINVFLQPDQSGAEGLVVAYDSRAADYRQLFIHGISPHVYVSLKLFRDIWKVKAREHNISIDDKSIDELYDTPVSLLKSNPAWHELNILIKMSDSWSTEERYYYFAKQTVHSFSYDIQWHTFIMNILEKSGGRVVIPPEEGKRFLQEVRGIFPEVPERNRRIDEQVRQTGMLYNIHGFPYIIWPDGNPPDSLLTDMKKYYAWLPQSSIAGITEKAYYTLYDYIAKEKKQWDLLTDTHDSILSQGLLHDTKERAIKMTEAITQDEFTSAIDGAKFRMKSETKVGFNWAGKSEKNNLGLRVYKFV